jgi:2-amino-4-hydroxy-6-hydroxymethyldihydropteridine diphosphokinase
LTQSHLYLIALGSNQRHPLIGSPANVLAEAIAALEMADIDVFSTSPIIASQPVGPSKRRFANAAAILSSPLNPPELLWRLQEIEEHFGRERRGGKWRARVLDLDIIYWSGGFWASDGPALSIPHPLASKRGFVLQPAAAIAPDWRDPLSGLTLRQLNTRFSRAKRLDRGNRSL